MDREPAVSLDETHEEAELRMMEAIESLENRLRGVRTGRPSPSLVTGLSVDAYGASSPLQQLAAVSIADNNCLVIRPFDPSILGDLEKAIIKGDLGLNPENDGKLLRLVFPPLSEERRKLYAAQIRDDGEKARISVRNTRREANKEIDAAKSAGTSEDDCKRMKDQIQKFTDEYIKKVEALIVRKTAEIMEI